MNSLRRHTGNSLLAAFVIFLPFNLCGQDSYSLRLARAAGELTLQKVIYDPSYFRLTYPGGDVPADRGVCTDVVIRAYRKMGTDLQRLVHEDMKANFSLYPQKWGMKTTDRNIDHRRVPNLITFFSRKGVSLKVTNTANNYQPGDIVTWDLGRGITHIGIVSDRRSTDGIRPLIVHNIGNGQEISDCLFSFRVTGHFRYKGPE